MACLHARMDPEFAALRTSVRPGCTGLWQVSEASAGLIADAPQYDVTYLGGRTLRLDLWLLGRTVLKMVGLGSNVQLHDIPRWVGARSPRADVINLRAQPASAEPADGGEREQVAFSVGAGS